jgi:hypothetical protein
VSLVGPTQGHMRKLLLIAFAVAIGALSGVAAAYVSARPSVEGWHEVAWPFPRDGWPAGRAFRCDTVICGGEIELYLRPKAGFCNCDTGVADDDEVDRVADLDLLSEHFRALEPGKEIQVGGMSGRMRAYDLQMPGGTRRTAVGMAVSRRCDLMVVAAHGSSAEPGLQRAALDFLATDTMAEWMNAAMNGR